MGIIADPARLTIGGANTVWEYRKMPALAKKLEPAGKHDAAICRAASMSPATSTSTSLPSLIVSTYQAGKAIVVRNDNGRLNTHFRTFSKPMGIVADPTRLTIGGANTVWEYRNMPALAQKAGAGGQARRLLSAAPHSCHRRHRHPRAGAGRRQRAVGRQHPLLLSLHPRRGA